MVGTITPEVGTGVGFGVENGKGDDDEWRGDGQKGVMTGPFEDESQVPKVRCRRGVLLNELGGPSQSHEGNTGTGTTKDP